MSRLALGCLAVGLAVALTAPAPVTGQQTEQELVAQLEALEPQWEAAKKELAEAEDRVAREREVANGAIDTLMVGPLRVLVYPGQEDVARDVVGEVWRRDFAGWVDRSPNLERYAFFFQWAAHPKPFIPPHQRIASIVGSLRDSRQYMEDGVRRSVDAALQWDLAGAGYTRWASSVVSPVTGAWVYRLMVTTPSVAVRSCLAGSVKACVSAAGLAEDDHPLDDWYTPAELLPVAKRLRLFLGHRGAESCLRDDVQECDAALRASLRPGTYLYAIPMPPQVRGSLLWFALHQGGSGAWTRLLADSNTSLATALSDAAGEPVEEVVAKWRAWVMGQRPVEYAGMGRTSGITLLWIVLLSTLAMRSTRWRLG
jgi:hypothetical protein